MVLTAWAAVSWESSAPQPFSPAGNGMQLAGSVVWGSRSSASFIVSQIGVE